MTINEEDPRPDETPQDPDQEHPVQEAHGGSMAPGLVDDTGHSIDQGPPAAADE
jgi:hypothetical protein